MNEAIHGLSAKSASNKKSQGVPDRKALLFRTDADPQIGMGHLMRCLSIADAAGEKGAKCTFLCSRCEAADVAAARGYETILLSAGGENGAGQAECGQDPLPDRLPTGDTVDRKAAESTERTAPWYGEAELPSIGEILGKGKYDAVIVDSYAVTEAYLSGLHEQCAKQGIPLVYIDDVAAFAYPCDILINYNIYAPDWQENYERLYGAGKGSRIPAMILGAAYAPLRREFSSTLPREVRETATEVMISTGGADTEHLGIALARKILKRETQEDVRSGGGQGPVFHFVVGKMNRDRDALQEAAAQSENILLHFDVTDMAGLMRSCDAAISASGSTLYELCATQTPALTYILADNQIAVAEGFSGQGVMRCCGDVRKLGTEELAGRLVDEVIALCKDSAARRETVRRMREVTDAGGAGRIVEEILGAANG